ncbi:restriction endonuclease subunit S [Aeromonas hydrophila]|uniref:restriction endonuclease subunit S n=1 Tax=Aeromonas hydrophila TaxID=644 RepID=UPI0002FF3115|nr:restriction endonuclease subunit S [Aeromonas hydrophila]
MREISLPDTWIITQFMNLIELQNGFAYKSSSYVEAGAFVIRIGNVQDGYVSLHNPAYIKPSEMEGSPFELFSEDILISLTGNIGRVAIIKEDQLPAVLNQRVARVVLGKNIDRYFVFHSLQSRSTLEAIINKAKGAAQLNVSTKDILNIHTPIPPLAEQKEIAFRLDTLLAQVEATQARLARIPDIIKRFRQSVLAAAVSGKLTEEWRKNNDSQFPYSVCRLSDVIHEMRNGLSLKPNENGEGHPILRISSVRSFSLDQVDVRYLDISKKDQERYGLKQNDLLFTRYNGSVDFVGVCARIKSIEHDVLLYPDKLIRVRVDNEKIMPEYLEIFAASQGARDYIFSLVKSTSGQKGISGTDLKQLQVKLPSVSEQAEIVRRVEQLFAYADTLEQQAKAAKELIDNLTQAILAKAFRGELTADWRAANPDLISGDNSAAALLARIQAERANAKPRKRASKPAISPTSSGVTQ